MIKLSSGLALLLVVSTVPLRAVDNAPSSMNPATMMPNEWTEYRYERLSVTLATPDLAAEDKQLQSDMKAQEEKTTAAMIKADPKIAPILTTLTASTQSDWGKAAASPLSASDWQTIRAARATVLRENPDLLAANQALLSRKEALDAKVDAALIKFDPSLAPFISTLQARDRE